MLQDDLQAGKTKQEITGIGCGGLALTRTPWLGQQSEPASNGTQDPQRGEVLELGRNRAMRSTHM